MHEQLHEIIDILKSVQERMHALSRTVPDPQWGERTLPDKWSISENIEHLNLFSEVYSPIIAQGLRDAKGRKENAPSRYRRGIAGGMLWHLVGPTRFLRVKATPAFVPRRDLSPAQIRERFDRLQHTLVSLTASAETLPIDRILITSPVDPRMRYNLYATLGILARHQQRHLRQAENRHNA